MEPIHIFGCGAVGIPLAASLAAAGREVIGIRVSEADAPAQTISVKLTMNGQPVEVPIRTIGISHLREIKGPAVVTIKAHANQALAQRLAGIAADAPVILMQNGLGVERPFVDAGFREIHRCVLYIVAEGSLRTGFDFRAVTPSPLGVVAGSEATLDRCLAALDTPGFPFRKEADIHRESWTKTIINSVFNSICPLLDADNSLFSRNQSALQLAEELVTEGVMLAQRVGISLEVGAMMERVLRISSNSTQAISTLQDLRAGRETEIRFINLEMARIAASLQPPADIPRIACLGSMIELKSALGRLPGQGS